MIEYRSLNMNDAPLIGHIDRSEHIDLIYEMKDGQMVATRQDHECASWSSSELEELQQRFVNELAEGGYALGGFDNNSLAGFAVLGHQWRGNEKKQLQLDLMYVSRNYRRKGMAAQLMRGLADKARARGATELYISATETRSAVSFYKKQGARLAEAHEIDAQLFEKEPLDIHMILKL